MKEEIINNPNIIYTIIGKINDALTPLMPTYHSPTSLFMTQRCNIYSIILINIFGENATAYDNQDHVITKIGNHYYDVRGCIDNKENISEYIKCPYEYLYDVMFLGIGNYKQEFDDEIINVGVNTGKKYLESLNKNKAL